MQSSIDVPAIGWHGRLELGFERDAVRTVLARRSHRGPLGVQRPFYGERDAQTCQVYLLHPPGGLVAGDELAIDIAVGAGARALVTTPAATKLYRSTGALAAQQVRVQLARDACFEWLPQETIAFDATRSALATRFELAAGAQLIAWEVTCLGRPASGERFMHGQLDQRLEITREGTPLMLERTRHRGGGPALDAAWGLRGFPVVGTLVCVSDRASDELLPELRERLEAVSMGECSCTRLPQVLVCRYLGPSAERAIASFRAAWELLRPQCLDAPAQAPRIWVT